MKHHNISTLHFQEMANSAVNEKLNKRLEVGEQLVVIRDITNATGQVEGRLTWCYVTRIDVIIVPSECKKETVS